MITRVPQSRSPTETAVPRPARRAGALFSCMVVAGLVLGVWMTWTLISWVAAGHIHQITRYREHGQASWIAACVYEAVFACLAVGLVTYVVRGVVRSRRMTFDAMLLLALFLSSWLDPAFNFYKQIFLYSSQFVNVNAWCGKMPGVLNHECGRMPEPLVIPLLYMMVLLAAIIAGRLVAGAQQRATRWSVGRTIGLAALVGVVFDFVMEMPSLGLHLWSYSSNVAALAPPGLRGGDRYTLTTAFTFGVICASVTTLRYHRDDRGRTLLERCAADVGPRWRPALLQLAVIGFVQLTVIVSFLPAMVTAPYAGAWPRGLPRPLVNGLCDNNVSSATPYRCRAG